jgi:hypothetical protein
MLRSLLTLVLLLWASSAGAASLTGLINSGGTLTSPNGLTFSDFSATLDFGQGCCSTGLQTRQAPSLAAINAETINLRPGLDAITFGNIRWTGTVDTITAGYGHLFLNLDVTYTVEGLGKSGVNNFFHTPGGPFMEVGPLPLTAYGTPFDFHEAGGFKAILDGPFRAAGNLPTGTTSLRVTDTMRFSPSFIHSCSLIVGNTMTNCSPFNFEIGVNSGFNTSRIFTAFETAPISAPEPSTMLLLVSGLLGLLAARRRDIMKK